MQCFPQRLPEGSSPFPCSYHLQRLHFTLPSMLRRWRRQMSPSTYCPLATGKRIYSWVGWLPGSPFPLGNHQSDTRHIDPFCCGEGSQCVLHFPGLPIVQGFSRESQKLGKGVAEAKGKSYEFYTSNFWSCSSSIAWSSLLNCLELSQIPSVQNKYIRKQTIGQAVTGLWEPSKEKKKKCTGQPGSYTLTKHALGITTRKILFISIARLCLKTPCLQPAPQSENTTLPAREHQFPLLVPKQTARKRWCKYFLLYTKARFLKSITSVSTG